MFIIDKQLLNVNGPEQKIFGIARPGRWHRKSAPGGQKFGNRGPENGEKRLFKRIRFRYNGKSEGNTAQFQVVKRAGKFFVR